MGERRERAGASSGPFSWSWEALTGSCVDAVVTALLCCVRAPMQKKCMAVRPQKPATRCSSMAQGARSQGAHRPSQAAMSSLLMLADMPQPLHSSQTTQPATLCLRAAFLQESTPVIHTHGHTDLAHIFRHSYHTHTHKQILGSSLEISHLQLLDSSLRSMLSPEKL